MENYINIVKISTDEKTICNICKEEFEKAKFADSINHYINKHQYDLLYIGNELARDYNNNVIPYVIAILGYDRQNAVYDGPAYKKVNE